MIWLIGCGGMSKDYAAVLSNLGERFQVIGRGEGSANKFQKETGHDVLSGGVSAFFSNQPPLPKAAIVSVGVADLSDVTSSLINYGVKNILVEKPAGLNSDQVRAVLALSSAQGASVFVAYNRRFYSSVQMAKKLIDDDGGVASFNFEFTEWASRIGVSSQPQSVKNNWFFANSTHVIDLAFFLGGKPVQLDSHVGGVGVLDWHSSGSCFVGSGVTDKEALFSYQANWAAPGRWGLEVMTARHRYIFSPLEELKVQKLDSIAQEAVPLDDESDRHFKPGLFKQLRSFLGSKDGLCTLQEHVGMMDAYEKISGYCDRVSE